MRRGPHIMLTHCFHSSLQFILLLYKLWIWLTSFVLPTQLLQLLTKLQILTRYCIHSPTHGDTGGTVGAASEASAAFAHRPDLGDHLGGAQFEHWTEDIIHCRYLLSIYLHTDTDLGLVDGLHLDLVAGALGRDGPAPGVRPQLSKMKKNILHLVLEIFTCHKKYFTW